MDPEVYFLLFFSFIGKQAYISNLYLCRNPALGRVGNISMPLPTSDCFLGESLGYSKLVGRRAESSIPLSEGLSVKRNCNLDPTHIH